MTTVLVVLAGGLGALTRYWLAAAVQRRSRSPRPWGTAVVNVVGAAALGVVAGLADPVGGRGWPVVASIGFLGAFTTFSTWMVETIRLADEGGRAGLRAAAVNLAGPLIVGSAALAIALTVTR